MGMEQARLPAIMWVSKPMTSPDRRACRPIIPIPAVAQRLDAPAALAVGCEYSNKSCELGVRRDARVANVAPPLPVGARNSVTGSELRVRSPACLLNEAS